jgi:hypothetical protein
VTGQPYTEPSGGPDDLPADDLPADDLPADDLPADDLPSPEAGRAVADPRIAAAMARLEGLGERPPDEHVEVYEDVHRVLSESLTDAQEQREEPGGAAP